MGPLQKLKKYGQSYWLDNLSRGMIQSGQIQKKVAEEGLRGITSNPATFNQAIAGSTDYDDLIKKSGGRSPQEIYQILVLRDVRDACDLLRPVYEESDGKDGFVSLEVSPHLAHDTRGSIEEAVRLFKAVERPNLMIKIPGTQAGYSAIEELFFEGIHVNITLLFAIEQYETVAYAYLNALERRIQTGKLIAPLASVASFFLSRMDTLVDKLLNQLIRQAASAGGGLPPEALLGKAAVANAKLAYQRFKTIIQSNRWKVLEQKGAQIQRILWASTSTKNPSYRDVMYVEPLIGPYTVNTMPEQTIAAFADHGVVDMTVEDGLDEARRVIADLEKLGIHLPDVTGQLLTEGIQKFIEPYDQLMNTIAARAGK